MAGLPGVQYKKFRVSYLSNNGEIPIGFLVHNKGLWGSNIPEYLFISANGTVTGGDYSLKCFGESVTATSALFGGGVSDSASISSSVEIAPIYASDLGLT